MIQQTTFRHDTQLLMTLRLEGTLSTTTTRAVARAIGFVNPADILAGRQKDPRCFRIASWRRLAGSGNFAAKCHEKMMSFVERWS
jgi:hypothetical protein